MKIVVIGGYGHIGSYLVPKLIKLGNEVIVISRSEHSPYINDWAWSKSKFVSMDRSNDTEFDVKVAEMNPDIVIDLINFKFDETKSIVTALKDTNISHYLFCSSIWAHGRAEILPSSPNSTKAPLDEYGKNKYLSEQYLKEEYRVNGFPSTVIMPGQISGPGWDIINPQGNMNNQIFQDIADGKPIDLPNFGMETLHHVHASDVAQVFVDAITHRNQALGESFHAVEKNSITLYGYAQLMYKFFGKNPQINFLPWPEWVESVNNKEYSDHTYFHIARSGNYDIENGHKLIDYIPQYSIEETIELSIQGAIDRGVIHSK
ncbi:NAD-dependent epimerase/dehydratase family protein [Companilactobacillus mishanensis]|uniref:NAD-dependent epimerase/dehydratase family protein n=1 Tax=Companilactobacillus mishanensis TaxID=2486008 RepID=A0A5P0ZJ56_9LACO|nr:NAD-dependent epimerase/dehydratase family protein [Companilactobacillus mishanensis]MQS52687.1 NAD-dependent epimerase/dehydratase family protein [Companilactobacillus mishanensis]